MDLSDSARGCLLGGAIGDAFGSAYEGAMPPVQIDETTQWVLTDDTQLTLATCEAITLAGHVDPEAIARRMTDWFQDNRLTRLGSGTLKALRELSQGGHWALCGRRGEMAAGCGPAARMAPLAFWLDPTESDDRRTIRDVARITHHSDEAYSGALAIIAAVRAAAWGKWREGTKLASLILPLLPDTNVRDRLAELAPMNPTMSLAALAKKSGTSGYVVEAVPLAICAAERMIGEGFFPVMRQLIEAGGDTDTIAALAGQIAGTVIGASGLPTDRIDRIPGIADVESVAAEFVAALERRK
jgi:ADP-ribosylglycohydrolase